MVFSHPAAIAPGPAQFVAEVLAHLTRVFHRGQQPPSHVPLTTNPTGAITPQQSDALIGVLAATLAPPQAARPTHQPAQKKRRGPSWPVPGEDNGDPRRWQRLPELLEAYFGCRDLSEKTKVGTAAAIRDFDALVRGRPIGEITPQTLTLYKQTIMARPGRVGRAQAAPATVQKLLNHVRCVLSWATDEEAIITDNPGAKVRPPPQRRKAQVEDAKRRAFSREMQTHLFASPLFTGCISRDRLTTSRRVKADAQNRVVISALSDLSFTIESGERVALVGHNGARKSTLLRTLAGVYEPVGGRLTVEGEIGSLIDPAAGLDPLSTGRENIRLRALYRGLNAEQT